jgi:putative transposase
VLGQNRGTQRHRPRKVDGDRELLGVMRKIVETFPRHGSERTHRVLTGPEAFGGWKVNIKRVHRIWKEEHMQVPQKQRKRRRLPGSSANGCVRHRATHRNHVWSYDFLTERTEDGRQLRILVVIDEFTRECLAIEVARSFTARDVIMTLQYLFAVRGAPEHLRSDNGKLCKPGIPTRTGLVRCQAAALGGSQRRPGNEPRGNRPRQVQERGLLVSQ